MQAKDAKFQGAGEIGRIYRSITDKKALADFFLESVLPFIRAERGYLFLAGGKGQIWLESSAGPAAECPPSIETEARAFLERGKPGVKDGILYAPLIAGSAPLGTACFSKPAGAPFGAEEVEIAFDLASQMSGALRNLILFEENLKMERLAAVGETLSMVMHEIKNIIQIAKLSDELIRRGIKTNNEKFLSHGLDGAARALKEMDGFVWDMLSLTKDYAIEPQKINPAEILAEIRQDLSEKAGELGIALDFQTEESLGRVDGDRRSLYRAVLNLVQNAVEACDKEESFIRIRVRPLDPDFYEIKIADNGRGMSPEVRAKIFQAFFSTKGRKGNGLGLMIVENTCKAHRGRIDFESEPGKGTAFTLTFPRSPPRE
jgi:signal transduction histidine kinase